MVVRKTPERLNALVKLQNIIVWGALDEESVKAYCRQKKRICSVTIKLIVATTLLALKKSSL